MSTAQKTAREKPDYDAGLPAAEDTEKLLFGLVLIGSWSFAAMSQHLHVDDFITERHQRIFRAMLEMQKRGDPIDPVTLAEQLKRTNVLSAVGGMTYLISLTEGTPAISHPEKYVEFVLKTSIQRQAIRTADATAKRFMNRDADPDELLASTVAAFQTLQSRNGWHEEPPAAVPRWPDPIHEDGLHGIAGELVRSLEPHTEADVAALLVQFLTAWGSLAGRGPYYLAEADRHHTNLYTVIVGLTSKGRKGTSWSRMRAVLETVDDHWTANCMLYGLGSGEALIEAVSGDDRRRLVMETEFARLLSIIERDGMTISSTFRQCWDSGEAHITTRSAKEVHVTGGHLSMVGHVTRDELLKRMSSTEVANGFGNRILWVCARRSKELPLGGGTIDFGNIPQRLKLATDRVRRSGNTRMHFDREAETLWKAGYHDLSAGGTGMYGSLTGRAEAQVCRLALVYALLDSSPEICAVHLQAALAVWRYCDDSVRYVWGNSLGDVSADKILKALRMGPPAGLTRLELSHVFSNNASATEIDRAVNLLSERGLIQCQREVTHGRPYTRYSLNI